MFAKKLLAATVIAVQYSVRVQYICCNAMQCNAIECCAMKNGKIVADFYKLYDV